MEVNNLIDWNSLTPQQQIQQTVQANNSWSAAQAQKQMDFQERMSNTAHQRQIEDLKAAGLNPVLSAKLGGASTPSGAMGTTDTSGTSALIDLLAMSMQTANSAAGAARASAEDDKGFNLFGFNIDLNNAKWKNPRTPGQLAWNFGIDFINENMPDIGAAEVSVAVKSLWEKLGQQREDSKRMPHHGRQEAIEEGQRAAASVVKELRPYHDKVTYYEEGLKNSAKSWPKTAKSKYQYSEEGKKVTKKAADSRSTSAKGVKPGIGASLAGLGLLGAGVGTGLGNFRYGVNPQLQW